MVDFDALLEIADLNEIRDRVRYIPSFLHGYARVRSRGGRRISAHIDSAEMVIQVSIF